MKRAVLPLTLLWTFMVLYFTLLPADYLPESTLLGYDKLGHFGIFGGWTFLFGLFMMTYGRRPDIGSHVIWLAGFLFSSAIEILQYSLPVNRMAEWGDVVANVLGISLATSIIMLLRRPNLRKYLALE